MLTVRVVGPGDWKESRDLRLEMLEDAPTAFVEPLASARALSDADWRGRHARHMESGARSVVVVDDLGVWRGHMAVQVDPSDPRCAWLLAVWVHPQFRGGELGAAPMMLGSLLEWLRERRIGELHLEVHEDNARAIAFYVRAGFELTGGRRPYPLDPSGDELEMRLSL